MVLVGIPWLLHNVFHSLFKGNSITKYVLCLGKFVVLTLIGCTVAVIVTNQISSGSIVAFFGKAVLAVLIPNFAILPFFAGSYELKRTVGIVKGILARRMKSSQ
jgi:hypothetical protein